MHEIIPHAWPASSPQGHPGKTVCLSVRPSVRPSGDGGLMYKDITSMFGKEEDSNNIGYLNQAIKESHKIIPQLRKSEIKKIDELALEDSYNDSHIPIRLLHMIIDLTRAKLQTGKKESNKEKKKENTKLAFIVRYQNHGIQMLNLGSIIHKEEIKETIPLAALDKHEPMIVYKYDKTIRNKIFNYKETVEEYVQDCELKMECNCSNSQFSDKDHGHVVTGDLHIIKNQKLRELFKKGPNYREKKAINWKKTVSLLKEDIKLFIKKWSDRAGIPEECFSEWKITLFKSIQEKVKKLKRKIKFKPVKNVLKDPTCLKDLKELKDQFVLVPIDKAANNVGLICKKYFLEILRKETSTETYEEYDNTAEEVIGAIRKGSSNIGIPVEKTFNDLPLIHATIKMHKNPIKFRFIIGSRTGVIKPAAKKLVQILKLVMKTHRRYCDKIKFYTGIERNWIVENNQKILQNMEKINNRKAARNIKVCDFSTLYTKIPSTDLKEKLKEVVTKASESTRRMHTGTTVEMDKPSARNKYFS